MILSSNGQVFFANNEAANILNTTVNNNEYKDEKDNFINIVKNKEQINNIYIEIDMKKIPLSIEVNKSEACSDDFSYINVW